MTCSPLAILFFSILFLLLLLLKEIDCSNGENGLKIIISPTNVQKRKCNHHMIMTPTKLGERKRSSPEEEKSMEWTRNRTNGNGKTMKRSFGTGCLICLQKNDNYNNNGVGESISMMPSNNNESLISRKSFPSSLSIQKKKVLKKKRKRVEFDLERGENDNKGKMMNLNMTRVENDNSTGRKRILLCLLLLVFSILIGVRIQ